MKKMRWLIIILAVVILVTGVVANTPERRATRFYNKNGAELNQIVERYIVEGELSYGHHLGTLSVDMDDVYVNVWDSDHLMMEFLLFSPMGKYCGIYFSLDDVPLSFQNTGEALCQVAEDQWEWQGEGDNRGMTSRIGERWYYFEAVL